MHCPMNRTEIIEKDTQQFCTQFLGLFVQNWCLKVINTDASATIQTQSVRSMMQTVCKLSKLSVFTYPPSRMNSVHIPTKQNEQCRCKMDLCLMPYNFEPKCVGEEFAAGYWDWDGVRKGIWNCGKYMTQIQCLFDLAMLPDEKTDENTITWLV